MSARESEGTPELGAVEFDPFAGPALLLTVDSTESQREIWTAARLGDDASKAYNESNSLLMRGPLDTVALERSLSDLLARHESLRATFSSDGLTMCVAEPSPIRLPIDDLAGLPDAERNAALARLREDEVERPFDLERGPLFRARLVRLGPEEHELIFSGHHIVVDGWSTAVLIADWAASYSAYKRGETPGLPRADKFSDYATASAQQRGGAELTAHENYWVSQFAGEIPVLELPTDRARPPLKSFASRRMDFVVDAGLAKEVKRVGAREGASFFSTLLAAFDVLLHRLSAQEDLVVGIPAAGQLATGRKQLVGHCVNTLPLRCRLHGREAFRDVLERVQTTVLDAFEHQDLTFGALLRKLPIPRDPSRQPLVSVIFNLDQPLSADVLRFEGLSTSFRSNPRHYESFDLFLNAVESPAGLALECQYNTDLFDGATISRWLAAYSRLLSGIVSDPGASVGLLPLLSDGERLRLEEWNLATSAPFPAEKTVHELIAEQARRTPHAIAVSFDGENLTYSELAKRAAGLARRLAASGVAPGSRVGLYVERSIEMVIGLLGILESGAAYVPLDPSYPPERISYMVEDAGIQILVTHGARGARVTAATVLEVDAPGAEAASDVPMPAVGPEDVAYVIYTSGSTGKPKGVLVPHRSVVNLLYGAKHALQLDEKSVVLAVTTLSFDIAVSEVILPLVVGARIVIADRSTSADGPRLVELLGREAITFMDATPATWRLLIDAGWKGGEGLTAVCTGEAMPRDLARVLVERVAVLWNGYGPTETTVWSTFWRVARPVGRILIGRPIANTQIHVWDSFGQPVPIGVVGEIHIGGDGVTHGYLNRPELTAERFLQDPSRSGAKVYRTGDLGRYLSDGNIECLGRNDHQVKVRGFRIELGEIEATLASHPLVSHAAVAARELRPGDLRLVAYLVTDGESPDDETLRSHLRRTLPEYMIPQHFLSLVELPLTPSGKVDRAALPLPDVAKAAVAYSPPATSTEMLVAKLWQDALGVGRLGRDDNFFALGGHSLLAAQVLSRLNRECKRVVPFRAVFEAPTVRGFAALLEQIAADGAPLAERIPRRSAPGPAPVTIMQERILLLEELDPERRLVHNLPSAFRLEGPLDVRAFEQSLTRIVARHETLRTSFRREGTELVQVVGEPYDVRLDVEDLSAAGGTASEDVLRARLRSEASVPFDLTKGPLFRARLFRIAPDLHVFFSLRHISIWDGWSFDVFREELSTLYAGFVEQRAAVLPELATSYSDFAAWHRRWMASDEALRQLSYWRGRLAGSPAPIALPLDKPRPSARSYSGTDEWIDIPRSEVDALTELAHSGNATLFMVLVSALNVLLHRYSGQRDLIVATPIRNRNHLEIENLIGLFTNTLPLRMQLDPSETFESLLSRVRAATLEALSHQAVPFELLANHVPPMRVMFSLQEARHRATSLGGVKLSLPHLLPAGTAFDLTFWLVDMEQGLTGAVYYNTDLFERDTIRRFLSHFRTLLRSVRDDRRQALRDLALVDEAERPEPARTAPATKTSWSARVEDALVKSALASTPRVATPSGERLSQEDVDARIRRTADSLRANDAPGRPVAVAIEDPAERLLAALGVFSAGCSVALLDPRDPPAVLSEQTAAVGACELPAQRTVAEGDRVAPPDASFRRDEAAIVVAAPSTRLPRTVLSLDHATVSRALREAGSRLGLGSETVALVGPGAGLFECLVPFASGAQLVVAEAETWADGARLARLLDERSVGFLSGPPSLWRRLLSSGWQGTKGLVGVATSSLPGPLAEQLAERLGSLFVAYTGAPGIWWALDAVAPSEKRALIGSAITELTLSIQDDSGRASPIGVPGEVVVGPTRTGDRARILDDGRLEYLGPREGYAMIDGARVDTAAAAAALASCPGVAEAAVVGRDDPEGNAALVGYVVPRGDAGLVEPVLREHTAAAIPFVMRPSRFVFVDTLPRAPDGTIARDALPNPFTTRRARAHVAPRTDLERTIARVWESVLGRSDASIHDDFFELGGTSLLVVQLVRRLETELRKTVPLASLLRSATIEGLASLLSADRPRSQPTHLVPLRKEGKGQPLYFFPGIGGTAFTFRELAGMLDDRPISGVHLFGVDGNESPIDDIEELARRYVSEIRQQQPEGPFLVAGYSSGGYVAYATAALLAEQGFPIGLLALLDCSAPGYPPLLPLPERIRIHLENFWKASPREKVKYARDRFANRLNRLAERRRLPWLTEEPVADARLAAVDGAMRRAMARYHPPTYSGELVILRADVPPEWPATRFDDPFMGWEAHVTGRLSEAAVPGEHLGIFERQNLPILAATLRRFLAER